MTTTTLTPSPRFATYALSGWNLSELLPEPTEEMISGRLAEIEAAVTAFESRRAELHPEMSPDTFLEMLRRYEEIVEQMNAISGYASLWFYSDTSSQDALTFRNRVRTAMTAGGNRMLFFTLWWRGLSDEEAERLLPRGAEASDYLHYLQDLRRFKPHTLDEKSEQIINIKDENGIGAIMTLYSMLTNRLEYTLEVDGETQTLTRDALMSYAFTPRPELRAAAYQELYRVYGREATILGQIYVNRVHDWHDEHVKLRGYRSPVSVRNVDNDIPDEAVQVLLEVARENAPIFQRYFRMKAGWLGLDRLRRYDIYAPLAASDRSIPYGDAVQSVLETFNAFHPRFAQMAERCFAESHVDSEIRKGKRGGAFCSTVLPRFTPWVLVNYAGRVRDVATLAHELGHAVHSMLAEHHSILTQHASLPLAETASVFGEMLMTDRLLREEPDPLARRELLAAAVDDVYATVLRQAYFVLFEQEAHEAILAGRSVEDVSEMYMGKLVEQFGDSVEIAPEFRYEWLSIPHIYSTPFYCYAYSFGQLLVLALYRRFQEEGEAFKPGYLRLLSYGGSARPEAILREVGIDMTDRAFWQGGFDLVTERIDELERL
ncbi:MAG TPA: M3 family oligoendopeptidase [Thermoanaerobaculia bacterium]|jgi:oligoendopeptidase F|nr:M3 family oligoendopeptidase [Thermoanaerobaculia bacterium]